MRVRPCVRVCVCVHASVFPRSEARSSIFNAAETTSTQPEPGEASFFAQANLACQRETQSRDALWKGGEGGASRGRAQHSARNSDRHAASGRFLSKAAGAEEPSRGASRRRANTQAASPLNKSTLKV